MRPRSFQIHLGKTRLIEYGGAMKRALLSLIGILASTVLFVSPAHAVQTGCPDTWTISATSNPNDPYSDFAQTIFALGANATVSVEKREYSFDGLIWNSYFNSAAAFPMRLLLLTATNKFSVKVDVQGCSISHTFEFTFPSPKFEIVHISPANYLKLEPKRAVFVDAKTEQAWINSFHPIKNKILESAKLALQRAGTKVETYIPQPPFESDSPPVPEVFSETNDCFGSSGNIDNMYLSTWLVGKVCKVALGFTGNSVYYILDEFTVDLTVNKAVTPTATKKPAVGVMVKKTTISCLKGKVEKKVTAMSPKCPTGYKKK